MDTEASTESSPSPISITIITQLSLDIPFKLTGKDLSYFQAVQDHCSRVHFLEEKEQPSITVSPTGPVPDEPLNDLRQRLAETTSSKSSHSTNSSEPAP